MEMLTLTWDNVAFLLIVGLIGGLVSGFIGSGGAFVLTPAMMSTGVPGVVAVASNICHKFPKALVGAHMRHKYGQVDIKLGLYLAVAASLGMWWGAGIQKSIRASYGEAGSNLYVSTASLIVLIIVGRFIMRDAVNIHRAGNVNDNEKPSRNLLKSLSFALMVAALAVGRLIIIGAMMRGHKESLMPAAAEAIAED